MCLSFDQATFEKWVTLCSPLAHLTMIVWCIVQAPSSRPRCQFGGFDYVKYAKMRFTQYAKEMAVREIFNVTL